MLYRVIGGDGKQYGPVTLEQLKTWVAENRFSAQSQIREEGSFEWKSAPEFPEIAELLGIPPSAPALPPLPVGTAGTPGRLPPQGLAIASLVLGILSVVAVVCGGLLAGIAAIACGHIAFNRARRAPAQYGGSGMAMAGFILGYVSLALSLVLLPGMFLPAWKSRTQRVSCANNLKQIGLALKTWAIDHDAQYPFNVSTNSGGTAELARPDENGYDTNAVAHLRIISDELATPNILVCPADSKTPYRFRSGTNISGANPQEVLVECPVHHIVVLGDGSVMQKSPVNRR